MASGNTPEKATKNSASERLVSLTDEDVERFVEAEAGQQKHSSEFLNFETRLWISLCVGFDNLRRVASSPNLRTTIFGLIDKCYSRHLRRKFHLEQEGTVTLDCLLVNTDK